MLQGKVVQIRPRQSSRGRSPKEGSCGTKSPQKIKRKLQSTRATDRNRRKKAKGTERKDMEEKEKGSQRAKGERSRADSSTLQVVAPEALSVLSPMKDLAALEGAQVQDFNFLMLLTCRDLGAKGPLRP